MATPPPAYSEDDDGAPPPYSVCVEHQPSLQVQLTIIDDLPVDNEAVAGVQETLPQYNYAPEVTLSDYLEHPLSVINNNLNMANSIKGLVNILYDQRKLPWKFKLQLVYKFNLLVYFFTNFVYQIVTCGVQRENIGYYITFIIIIFLGLIYETFELTCDLYPQVKRWYITCRQSTAISSARSDEPQGTETDTDVQVSHKMKAKGVLKEYLLHSIGEFLIFPCLVCSLYGYINEKSWQFNSEIAGFNFVFFIYTVVIDTLYIKYYLIWLLQKVIRVSYAKYDALKDEPIDEGTKLCRYFSPLYMTMPFTVLLVLLHWSMLAIVGIRIYVDNFSDNSSGSTGNYKSSSFTRYMIFCCAYLPIASWIAYIILNKYWFYEVYTVIKQSTDQEICMQSISPWVKLLTFIFDPVAYITVIMLILPFIAFTVGTFLPDYNSNSEVSTDVKTAAESLGILFIVLFLLSNLQATTAFGIFVMTIVIVLTIVGLFIAVILVVAAVIIIVGTLTGAFVVLGLMCFACFND